MTHFNDVELVNVIEHALPESRARHLDECVACRTRVEDLRAALARVSEDEVPDPSPLFWDHFSARVRQALDEDEAEAHRPSWLRWVHDARLNLKWTATAALLAAALIGGALRVSAPTPDERTVIDSSAPAVANGTAAANDPLEQESSDFGPIESDGAWALVRTVADEVRWDDDVTAGLGERPGWAERAALDLSLAERHELAQLLQAETKRPGA